MDNIPEFFVRDKYRIKLHGKHDEFSPIFIPYNDSQWYGHREDDDLETVYLKGTVEQNGFVFSGVYLMVIGHAGNPDAWAEEKGIIMLSAPMVIKKFPDTDLIKSILTLDHALKRTVANFLDSGDERYLHEDIKPIYSRK